MSAAAVLIVALLAQAPTPEPLVLQGYRLHLVVDESRDADELRALAGSGTVLWLRTSSNTLRDSTLEALARFPEAYVQLRPPLKEAHVRQLRGAPRAGAWLDAKVLLGAGLHWLGPRRTAVEIRGALDSELARKLSALRPSRIVWQPGTLDVSLGDWGTFAQLPGSKVLALPETPGTLCPELPWRAALATISLRVEEGMGTEPCRLGQRVVMKGFPNDAALALLSRERPTEFEIEVGPGERELERARAWVQRLEAAVRGERR
ncbi:hypothetical protein [Hyalangium versicolor]|uniref:hypothetical protein n=1 Tax=Hyalangium versicolor TaxID=2861190 RepID=UPI001CCE9911|nr:hypothetical protein [Hyalangium versicolor]